MTDRLRKAGRLQTGCFVVFCLAALVGTWALAEERYGYAAINGLLMAVVFWLYQINSQIIAQERSPRSFD